MFCEIPLVIHHCLVSYRASYFRMLNSLSHISPVCVFTVSSPCDYDRRETVCVENKWDNFWFAFLKNNWTERQDKTILLIISKARKLLLLSCNTGMLFESAVLVIVNLQPLVVYEIFAPEASVGIKKGKRKTKQQTIVRMRSLNAANNIFCWKQKRDGVRAGNSFCFISPWTQEHFY